MEPRLRVRPGLLVIVAATVLAILFGREHALSLESVGRLFIVGSVAALADRGRRWAAVVLGLLAVTACIGLTVGALRVGLGSLWGALFTLDAALFVLGYAWFLLAVRARPDPRPAASDA